MSTTVVSVRVRRELKEEAEKLGIDLRRVVEKALEEEIRRVRKERLRSLIDKALETSMIGPEDWVRAIRESRLEA